MTMIILKQECNRIKRNRKKLSHFRFDLCLSEVKGMQVKMGKQQATLKNLINSKLFRTIVSMVPRKTAYNLEYKRQYGRKINFDDPKRLTEKLFYLIRYNEIYNKEFIQKIYDKHKVREYIKEKGLEKILVKQLGHYKTIDEIDFSKLPNQFALKMTQSSGQNVICTNKEELDIEEVKNKFRVWAKDNKKKRFFLQSYYFTDDESITCEELIKGKNGEIPFDFRVCCCNGEPCFIYCDLDSLDKNNDKKEKYYRECFDIAWNYLPVDFEHRPRKRVDKAYIQKPNNLEEILDISRKLAEDFVFVRIDFYLVEDKIYFGELTPIPGLNGGFSPDEYDFIFGDMLKLPNKKIF